MLHKVLYSKTSDLYYTKFLSLQQGTLVVPGPEIADLWRQELIAAEISMETLTYADWVKELLQSTSWGNQPVVSKSELWDILHRVWKNLGAPENFNQFQKVFDLYTDLKSITEDAQVFQQILQMETSLTKSVIDGLSQVFSLKEIQDEYQNIRNIMMAISENQIQSDIKRSSIHLLGFKIFSGLQIDFIQNLSQVMDIYIYVPNHLENLVKDLSLNDWPGWVKEEKTHRVENVSSGKNNYKFIIYHPSEMDALWENLRGKKVQIYSSQIDLSQCHWGQQSFSYQMKTSSDQGLAGSNVLLSAIQDKLVDSHCSWGELKTFIQAYYNKQLLEKKNYPLLKWLQYTKTWLEQKLEFLDSKNQFSWLDFNILKNKFEMDAVRLFWQAYSEEKSSIGIDQVQKGLFFKPREENYLIIDESIQLKNPEEKYLPSSSKILSSLAPSVSKEWNVWYLEFVLMDCLGISSNSALYINSEALQFDLFYKKIIKDLSFELNTIRMSSNHKADDVKNQVKKIPAINFVSPSALLTYKNCPRQYYANYILNLSVKEEYQAGITESAKGEILHQCIEKVGKNKKLIEQLLQDQNLLKGYLEDVFESRGFKSLVQEEQLFEATEIMQHFLAYWNQFPLFENGQELYFEEEFQLPHLKMKGRIDFSCYDNDTQALMIFDFKKGTVPTYSELERYDQWQVLSYLVAWKNKHQDKKIQKIIMGYLNLSNMTDSTLVSDQSLSQGILPDEISVKELKNFELWEKEFEQHWNYYLQSLISEKEFLPNPKMVKVCDYCSIKNSCPRGVWNDHV